MVSSPFSHSERIHLLEIRFSILKMENSFSYFLDGGVVDLPFEGGI